MRSTSTTMGSLALAVVLALAGCGGGGGGTTTGGAGTSPDGSGAGGGGTAQAELIGIFIDGPVDGLSYEAQPSGLKGVTSNGGQYRYRPGDNVTFSLVTGGAPIVLGARLHPTATVATNTLASALPNGQQVAQILHALNHGVGTVMNVGGLGVPASVIAEINAYLASGGASLAGHGSDDAFLRHLQQTVNAPAVYRHLVLGSSNEFLVNTVLPHIQDSIAANPGPVIADGQTYRFSGSVTSTSTLRTQPDNCTEAVTTSNAGGILNVTVTGDIRQPGTYAAKVASGSFHVLTKAAAFTCETATGLRTVPGENSVDTIPPTTGDVIIVNTDGTHLSTAGFGPDPACVGGNAITGTVIGGPNPMITLTTEWSCANESALSTGKITIKLVGAP